MDCFSFGCITARPSQKSSSVVLPSDAPAASILPDSCTRNAVKPVPSSVTWGSKRASGYWRVKYGLQRLSDVILLPKDGPLSDSWTRNGSILCLGELEKDKPFEVNRGLNCEFSIREKGIHQPAYARLQAWCSISSDPKRVKLVPSVDSNQHYKRGLHFGFKAFETAALRRPLCQPLRVDSVAAILAAFSTGNGSDTTFVGDLKGYLT